jgi:hypothetical protein
MTTRSPLVVAFMMTALTSLACSRSKGPASAPVEKGPFRMQDRAPVPAATLAAQPGAAATGGAAQPTPSNVEAMVASRKLIRTGQITVEVKDFEQAAKEIGRLAESLGGYLAESQSSRGHRDLRTGTLTIRVPAERFAQAFDAVKGLGKVQTENLGTQDVTKAYTDLETRLRVKRETADRLRAILKDRAAKLSEILEAERELARVTEEIEQMEGERRYYDQQVALSTIAVTLQEPDSVVKAGVFSPVSQAVRDSLEVLAASLAGLIYALVFLAPWLVVAYVAWKIFKAVRARRRAKAAKEA